MLLKLLKAPPDGAIASHPQKPLGISDAQDDLAIIVSVEQADQL
jgi:hypothetical protein